MVKMQPRKFAQDQIVVLIGSKCSEINDNLVSIRERILKQR